MQRGARLQTAIPVVVIGFICIVLSDWRPVDASTSIGPITFEDVFGPCSDHAYVNGPTSAVIQNVRFTTPDIIQNYGRLGGPFEATTPFTSDWLCFFAYDAGATITFPSPVSAVAFDVGRRDDWGSSLFQISGTGGSSTTFTCSGAPGHVSLDFGSPEPTTVTIKWINNSGPTSILGIDNLIYTPVPEPFTAAAAGVVCVIALVTRRRRH